MKILWDKEGRVLRFPRDIVAGYNYDVDGDLHYLKANSRGIMDVFTGRLYLQGSIGGGSLDDYTYLLRLEAENSARHLVTANGDAQLDGSGAVTLSGLGHLEVSDRIADFDMTGDFSVEFDFQRTRDGVEEWLVSQSLTNAGLRIDIESNDTIVAVFYYTGGAVALFTSAVVDTDVHTLKMELIGTTASLYLDDVLEDSGTISGTFISSTNSLNFGRWKSADPRYFDGKLSALSIINDGTTVLALNFDGDAASTRIIDSALPAYDSNRHTVTANGDAQLDGNGACDFDGTGDYLSANNSTDFNFTTSDLTWECYVRKDNDIDGVPKFLNVNHSSTAVTSLGADFTGDNGLAFRGYTGNFSATIDLNQGINTGWNIGEWRHCAITRDGNLWSLWIDGTLADSVTVSFSMDASADDFILGALAYGATIEDYLDGAMARVHVSKGVARYTAPFTPPLRTEAITVDANTVLALDFAGDAGSTTILDSAWEAPTQPALVYDISGNERDGSVNGDPLYNVLGYITMDGVGDYLNGVLPANQPFTVYMVAEVEPSPLAKRIFGDDDAFIAVEGNMLGATESLRADAGTALSDTASVVSSKKLFAVVFDNTNGALYLDGVQVASGTIGANAIATYEVASSLTAMDFYGVYVTAGAYDSRLSDLIGAKFFTAPANTVAPAITGTTTVGQTLTCDTGTWDNGVSSYTYEWFSSPSTSLGVLTNTIVLTEVMVDEQLYCVVTATNPAGSPNANSNTTDAIAASWTPSEITTAAWYDAADATTITEATGVSQWDDKSGNVRNATQSVATAKPTITESAINGLPAMSFDGNDEFLLDLDYLAGVDHCAFAVVDPTTYTVFYGADTPGLGANSLHVGFTGVNNWKFNLWGDNYEPVITSNYVLGSPNIVEFHWFSGDKRQIYANGNLEGTSGTAGVIGTMAGGGRLGSARGINYGGLMGEFVVMTQDLTLANRQKMEGYLAHKWGLEGNLPVDHPYKSSAPTV